MFIIIPVTIEFQDSIIRILVPIEFQRHSAHVHFSCYVRVSCCMFGIMGGGTFFKVGGHKCTSKKL